MTTILIRIDHKQIEALLTKFPKSKFNLASKTFGGLTTLWFIFDFNLKLQLQQQVLVTTLPLGTISGSKSSKPARRNQEPNVGSSPSL